MPRSRRLALDWGFIVGVLLVLIGDSEADFPPFDPVGSVACGLMILSLLIKIIGLVRYRRTKEEMMMSIREKDRREMLAASHTMPAVMVGGRALTREQAAREQAAARYLEEHPDERAEEEHLVTGAGSPPMRMASMRGPGAVGQQQGALGGQGQGIGLMPPPTPEPGPAPALPSVGAPAAASQSQLVRGESSQVVLQQPYYPTPAAPAPARGMQNGVSGSSTDTVVAEPAPVARTGQQQPLKSAMSNKASQPQPQPSRPPQSAAGLTPAQFLASLPAATKAQLEQQIMAQLSQYSQPIADYVRAQYPTASAEQQQGAYAYYMGIYREQIEGEYVKWFMSQGR